MGLRPRAFASFIALKRAVIDGTDVEARADCMAASLMGATAFQGLGAMHALAHPIGHIAMPITDC